MCKPSLILIPILAALVPWLVDSDRGRPPTQDAADWPLTYNGTALTRIALSAKERAYYAGFPGKVARFRADQQEIVIRVVESPTRKLHPAADCLRGSGYQVKPQPAMLDSEHRIWGCVLAENGDRWLRVCEQITDVEGNAWYDVSSWYWAAALGRSNGPWRAVTIAESIASEASTGSGIMKF